MRKIQSPNTFFVRYTAQQLIKKNGGYCTIYELVKEVQKKYRKVIVRYDMTIAYLVGGPFIINCKEHKVYPH